MRRSREAVAGVLLVLAVLGGCPAHTDYGGAQRLTDHTAYTLRPGEALVGVGLVGTTYDNLLASIRLEWSPFVPGLEIGTNLAHDVLPLVNVYAKYSFLDTRWIGMSARLGFRWLSPRYLWMIPDDAAFKQELRGADLYMVPAAVTVSFPLARWVGVHAELSYTYTPVAGDLVLDETYYNGGVVWHELTVHPSLHFYVGDGVALLVGVDVPVYSAISGEGYSETPHPTHPGVLYGMQASLSTRFDVARLVTPWLGLHVAWEHLNLRLTAAWGLRFFDESLLERSDWLAYVPIPGIELFWRL